MGMCLFTNLKEVGGGGGCKMEDEVMDFKRNLVHV